MAYKVRCLYCKRMLKEKGDEMKEAQGEYEVIDPGIIKCISCGNAGKALVWDLLDERERLVDTVGEQAEIDAYYYKGRIKEEREKVKKEITEKIEGRIKHWKDNFGDNKDYDSGVIKGFEEAIYTIKENQSI